MYKDPGDGTPENKQPTACPRANRLWYLGPMGPRALDLTGAGLLIHIFQACHDLSRLTKERARKTREKDSSSLRSSRFRARAMSLFNPDLVFVLLRSDQDHANATVEGRSEFVAGDVAPVPALKPRSNPQTVVRNAVLPDAEVISSASASRLRAGSKQFNPKRRRP